MKSVIKLEPVEVEEQNLHLILNAQVNGKDVRLVLDTGASRTCFDYDYFVEIGAIGEDDHSDIELSGLGGLVSKNTITTVDSLTLGDFTLRDYFSVVTCLSAVNEVYSRVGIEEIHGILGGDLLKVFGAVIRYDRFELILKTRRKDFQNIRLKHPKIS